MLNIFNYQSKSSHLQYDIWILNKQYVTFAASIWMIINENYKKMKKTILILALSILYAGVSVAQVKFGLTAGLNGSTQILPSLLDISLINNVLNGSYE